MTLRRRTKKSLSPALALAPAAGLAVLATLAACGGAPEEAAAPEAPPERVENAALGVAIADLSPLFVVARNEGQELVLEPRLEGAPIPGRLEVLAAEPGSSVNLVAAVQDHAAGFESRPDGEFRGQRELGSPLGTAFYSRGRYRDETDGPTEETVIFVLHPDGQRILSLRYRYPAGEDSTERLQSMFEVLGELEPSAPPTT